MPPNPGETDAEAYQRRWGEAMPADFADFFGVGDDGMTDETRLREARRLEAERNEPHVHWKPGPQHRAASELMLAEANNRLEKQITFLWLEVTKLEERLREI